MSKRSTPPASEAVERRDGTELRLTRFITEAARTRDYPDVIWAAEHHRRHYEPDVVVELCLAVAYAELGDAHALSGALPQAVHLAGDVESAEHTLRNLLTQHTHMSIKTKEELVRRIRTAVAGRRKDEQTT
jgi:hypothetical protein